MDDRIDYTLIAMAAHQDTHRLRVISIARDGHFTSLGSPGLFNVNKNTFHYVTYFSLFSVKHTCAA